MIIEKHPLPDDPTPPDASLSHSLRRVDLQASPCLKNPLVPYRTPLSLPYHPPDHRTTPVLVHPLQRVKPKVPPTGSTSLLPEIPVKYARRYLVSFADSSAITHRHPNPLVFLRAAQRRVHLTISAFHPSCKKNLSRSTHLSTGLS